MRKQITAEVGVLGDKKFQKYILQAKQSSKSVFFYKSNSLPSLICCQTCLFEILQILSFSIRNCRVVKNDSKSNAFEIPDSKHDASYKKCFKNRLFSKSLIQFLFLNENKFFRNKFSKNAQKSQHRRPYGVFWPAKLFLVSQFSKKSWFSNNTFFIENWCVVNILTQVLTLFGTQFKLWHENFCFV